MTNRMSKEEFMRMHDWVAMNALCRPNNNKDPKEGYFPVPRVNPDDPPVQDITFRDLYMRTKGKALRKLGATDQEVEEAFNEWFKGYTHR